jgi:hypothetical protein
LNEKTVTTYFCSFFFSLLSKIVASTSERNSNQLSAHDNERTAAKREHLERELVATKEMIEQSPDLMIAYDALDIKEEIGRGSTGVVLLGHWR